MANDSAWHVQTIKYEPCFLSKKIAHLMGMRTKAGDYCIPLCVVCLLSTYINVCGLPFGITDNAHPPAKQSLVGDWRGGGCLMRTLILYFSLQIIAFTTHYMTPHIVRWMYSKWFIFSIIITHMGAWLYENGHTMVHNVNIGYVLDLGMPFLCSFHYLIIHKYMIIWAWGSSKFT